MPLNDRRTTVFALRRRMAAFVAAREWRKFHRPKNLSMSLANATGIDLAASFESKMADNERKYPADRVRGKYKKPRRPE